MNVKLQIKEVKEETRPITLEEKCMFLLSTDMHYSQEIRDEIRKRLDALGLLIRVDSKNIVFRTETIRDATPEEVIAWHCIGIWASCSDVGKKCKTCAKNYGCEYGDNYSCRNGNNMDIAKELLKGKEVILSLTEE